MRFGWLHDTKASVLLLQLLVSLLLLGCFSETTLLNITHLPTASTLQARKLLPKQNAFNLQDYSAQYTHKREAERARIAHFSVFDAGWYPPKKPWYPVAYLALENDGKHDENVVQEYLKTFVINRAKRQGRGAISKEIATLVTQLANPAKHPDQKQEEAELAAFMLHKAQRAAYAMGADFLVLQKASQQTTRWTFALAQGSIKHATTRPTLLRAIAGKYALADFGFILGKNNTIAYVKRGSNAEKAGLHEGYQVLTLDGEFAGSTPHMASLVLARKKAGDLLQVEYLTKGAGKTRKKRLVYPLDAAR